MTSFSSMLLERHVVTLGELEESLRRQALRGGDLGTNLLEVGALVEDELHNLLADYHDLPAGPYGRLPPLTEQLEKLVSKDAARRYHVFPLMLAGNELHLATTGRLESETEKDLREIVGFKLRPVVVTPLRLHEALWRHCEVPFPKRYRAVLDHLEEAERVPASDDGPEIVWEEATMGSDAPAPAKPYRRMSEIPGGGVHPSTREAGEIEVPPPSGLVGPRGRGEIPPRSQPADDVEVVVEEVEASELLSEVESIPLEGESWMNQEAVDFTTSDAEESRHEAELCEPPSSELTVDSGEITLLDSQSDMELSDEGEVAQPVAENLHGDSQTAAEQPPATAEPDSAAEITPRPSRADDRHLEERPREAGDVTAAPSEPMDVAENSRLTEEPSSTHPSRLPDAEGMPDEDPTQLGEHLPAEEPAEATSLPSDLSTSSQPADQTTQTAVEIDRGARDRASPPALEAAPDRGDAASAESGTAIDGDTGVSEDHLTSMVASSERVASPSISGLPVSRGRSRVVRYDAVSAEGAPSTVAAESLPLTVDAEIDAAISSLTPTEHPEGAEATETPPVLPAGRPRRAHPDSRNNGATPGEIAAAWLSSGGLLPPAEAGGGDNPPKTVESIYHDHQQAHGGLSDSGDPESYLRRRDIWSPLLLSADKDEDDWEEVASSERSATGIPSAAGADSVVGAESSRSGVNTEPWGFTKDEELQDSSSGKRESDTMPPLHYGPADEEHRGTKITQPWARGRSKVRRDTNPYMEIPDTIDAPIMSIRGQFAASLQDEDTIRSPSSEVGEGFRYRGPFTRDIAELAAARAMEVRAVLAVLLRYAQQFFDRTLLLVVQGEHAHARLSHNVGLDLGAIQFNLQTPSILQRTMIERAPVVDQLSREGVDAVLRQLLRYVPKVVAVVPVTIRGRVVALVYGDDPAGVDARAITDVSSFAEVAAASMARIIIQRKHTVDS